MLLDPTYPTCQIFPPSGVDGSSFLENSRSTIAEDDQMTIAWKKFRQQQAKPQFQASTWVKLLRPLTAYSFDEAWLLCNCGNDQWLAWVPDYGEVLLSIDEMVAQE